MTIAVKDANGDTVNPKTVEEVFTAGATTPTKAEDAAHASGDVGVMALAVRKATPANTSGADGDYEPLQVNGGRLWTRGATDQTTPGETDLNTNRFTRSGEVITGTIGAAGTYAAGDVIGGKNGWIVKDAAGNPLIDTWVEIKALSANTLTVTTSATLSLRFFTEEPAFSPTDNTVPTWTEADANLIGIFFNMAPAVVASETSGPVYYRGALTGFRVKTDAAGKVWFLLSTNAAFVLAAPTPWQLHVLY